MKSLARKLGLLTLMAAALAVAGHIYAHCTVLTAGSYAACSLCSDIQGTSVGAAVRVDAGLVFLRVERLQPLTAVSAEKTYSETSRAPPGAVLS